MRLISRMAEVLQDERTFNEKLALALMIPMIYWVWGPTCPTKIHIGHAYALIVVGLLLVFMNLPSISMKAFGLYLSIWVTWIFSSAFADLIPAAIIRQTLETIILIVSAAVYFLIIYRGEMNIEKYRNWICSLTLTLCAVSFLLYYWKNLPAVAFHGNQNFFAAWCAIGLPFFFDRKWFYFIPIILWALVICMTTTAFIAAMAGTLYYIYPRAKHIRRDVANSLMLVIIPAAFWYAFVYHPFINSVRFEYWKDVIQIACSKWHIFLFGVGPGVLWRLGDMIHSEYFYGLFYFGTIGLVLYFFIIKSVPRSDEYRELYASFVAVLVDMIGNHVFHTTPTAVLSIVPIALLFRLRRNI